MIKEGGVGFGLWLLKNAQLRLRNVKDLLTADFRRFSRIKI